MIKALDEALNAIHMAFSIDAVVVHEHITKDSYDVPAGTYKVEQCERGEIFYKWQTRELIKMTPLLANHLHAIAKADLYMASGDIKLANPNKFKV
jgi:hypothetical protein